jgi:RNA 2',3'-cyclic 3'-phosphodiesterase
MSEKIRSFVAFALPESVLSRIRELQDRLKDERFSVRWTRPESIHLTLKFLGDVPESEVDGIAAAMDVAAAEKPPFSLHAKGLGVFPGIKRAKVIWIGLGGDLEPLKTICADLESSLERVGFPKETRPFKGHLTIGRPKGQIDPKRLGDVLGSFSAFASEPFEAGELILYKSDLKPSGAVYTKLKSVLLARPRL